MGDGRYDGDRATRLVDASYALHMAVIALNGVDLDQDSLSYGCADLTADDSGGPMGATRESYLERFGDEVDDGFIHPIFKATLAMQNVLQRVDDPEISQCIKGAIQELDDVIKKCPQIRLRTQRNGRVTSDLRSRKDALTRTHPASDFEAG
ncbi:MAG: hypothetical protein ACLP6E_03365 [Acidimicrobiales bacterium]